MVHESLEIEGGVTRTFAEGLSSLSEVLDGEGGWLLLGFIKLRTDDLDKSFTPHPKVDWLAYLAMSSYDALMAVNGTTTALDAMAIGDICDGGDRLGSLEKMIDAVEETQKHEVGRTEHRLHLRCKLPHHTTLPLFRRLIGRGPVTLVSLMGRSPDQRQLTSHERYREYHQGKHSLINEQMAHYEEEQLTLAACWSQFSRTAIAQMCRECQAALASYNDATHDYVLESYQLGSVVTEFPTTSEVAEASRQYGMSVLMGASNVVHGGSHSGDVAAHKLTELGFLDILSSDYYPASLLGAAFRVADDDANRLTLPQIICLVIRDPARALNLNDRGVATEGKHTDLVLVHRKGGNTHIDRVWHQGERVF